jgi:hypothetical protein
MGKRKKEAAEWRSFGTAFAPPSGGESERDFSSPFVSLSGLRTTLLPRRVMKSTVV